MFSILTALYWQPAPALALAHTRYGEPAFEVFPFDTLVIVPLHKGHLPRPASMFWSADDPLGAGREALPFMSCTPRQVSADTTAGK